MLVRYEVDVDAQDYVSITMQHVVTWSAFTIINQAGISALMYATRQEQKEVARFLLDSKANINLQEKVGLSAPFIAVQGKHNTMLNLFMEYENLDLTIKDKVSSC